MIRHDNPVAARYLVVSAVMHGCDSTIFSPCYVRHMRTVRPTGRSTIVNDTKSIPACCRTVTWREAASSAVPPALSDMNEDMTAKRICNSYPELGPRVVVDKRKALRKIC